MRILEIRFFCKLEHLRSPIWVTTPYWCHFSHIQVGRKQLSGSVSRFDNLQLVTRYLRLTLIFTWNSTLREKFNYYFQRSFLLGLTKVSFWQGDWALGYHPMEFTQPACIHLRCISETSHAASQRHLKEGWLICKSWRRLRWDVLRTSPQRRLWDFSGLFRDVSELHLRL